MWSYIFDGSGWCLVDATSKKLYGVLRYNTGRFEIADLALFDDSSLEKEKSIIELS